MSRRAEHQLKPQSDITSQEFNAIGKGKQKEYSLPDDTVRVSTSPITSENYAKPRVSDRADRIRQWIMLRHDGSTSRAPIRAKTTDVAYGHMDNRVATAPSQPRKRWKGVLKKKQLQSGSSTVNATGAPQQQDHRPSSPNSSSDSHIGHNDDVEASFCRVVVNLLCFCNLLSVDVKPVDAGDGPYRDPAEDNPVVPSRPPLQIPPIKTTPPLNHPPSIEMAATSSLGSRTPHSAYASPGTPQSSGLPSPAVAQTTPSAAPSSTAAVQSAHLSLLHLSLLENLLLECPSCSPQEDDLPLRNVLSPEEIAVIHEYRRLKGDGDTQS
ncbi:hypothetical protein BU15DRAFT_68830 [Melanogaster broomeanus]|nr:hypothetical protein BU15DRAFT_68830 [Melanogaster broomeanus]